MDLVRAEKITIDVEGGKFTGFIAQPGTSAPKVLVYHAWWGLNSFFQDLAVRLANEGFTVLAPDLYDGKTGDTIQEAQEMLAHRDVERHTFIAESAVRWMQEQPSDYPGLGLVGFSMGGSWALELASRFPETIKAVVLYYGSGDTDYSKIRARILGHFGGLDAWTPQSDIEYMENAMRPHGTQYQFLTYPDAEHWFVETNRPEYREEDAALGWERTVKFLREELTGKG